MEEIGRSTGDADDADFARTFDYWSPAFAPDPYPLLRKLRADGLVAHSDELDRSDRQALSRKPGQIRGLNRFELIRG